jgi:myo-inositol-1-phosphate synthase
MTESKKKKIKVALAGVGNCASSLVQGVEFYKDASPDERVPGLMHVVLGGYHVGDVEFVAAFDVDATKVGLDLGKAIYADINNTIKFAEVGDLGVTVLRGPTCSCRTCRLARRRPRSTTPRRASTPAWPS